MELKDRVYKILKDELNLTEMEPYTLVQKIYTDYRDRKLSLSTISNILTNENPNIALQDYFYEMSTEYADDCGYTDLLNQVKEHMPDAESYDDTELLDIITEQASFYYDINDFNQEQRVNLMLDTGDANYDFACNNALNYFDEYSGKLPDVSPILWLANQQNKKDLLLSEMKQIYKNTENGQYANREVSNDTFVESVIQELENNNHCCTIFTFMLKIPLLDLIELKSQLKTADPESTITIDKNTDCGLFAPYVGGGSCLEIQCDNDIIIPAKIIYDIYVDGMKPHGYDIDEVYGLCDSCWHGTIKSNDLQLLS